MYGPGDPRRVHFSTAPSPPGSTAYPASAETSQISITSAPDGNYLFLMPQQFAPQLPSIASASNSTTDFGNSRGAPTETVYRRTIAEASSSSGSIMPGNAFSLNSYSLVKPVQTSSQPTFYATPTGPSAAGSFTATSYPSQYSTLTMLSQPSSPHHAPQPQLVTQQFMVQQSQPQPQPQPPPPQSPPTFMTQGGGAAGAPALMVFTSDPGAAPGGAIYSLQPASPQLAAAAMQSGTAQFLSSVQLSSPNPQVGGGQVTYVVNSAPSATLVSYPTYSDPFVAFQGAAQWQAPGAAVAVRPAPPASAPQQTFITMTSRARPPLPAQSLPSYPPRATATPPAAVARHGLGGRVSASVPAAVGSPGGPQPAALGVRSFMAPKPVGTCMVPGASLITCIPPLALPCPVWGKIPARSSPGHSDSGRTALLS